MEIFISMLRGINVSGQKKIQMSDLKALFEGLKFKDVITYIQSGNVIFKTKQTPDKDLSRKIEVAILTKYGFEVPVIIRTADEMQKSISANPFITQDGIDTEKLYVTFLSAKPEPGNLEKLLSIDCSPEKFIVINKEIYLYCPAGYGSTKLSNNFFENKLKLKATTRNLKTVNKLLSISNEMIK
jgi:uncharacterized protein (DUF1697 family)